MPRSSAFAEVALHFRNSSDHNFQFLRALLALGSYYESTPATGNPFVETLTIFQQAGVPAGVLTQIQQLYGTNNLTPHV